MKKYTLSKDKAGLLRHWIGVGGKENFYHIHSNELTEKEMAIRADMMVAKNNLIDNIRLANNP